MCAFISLTIGLFAQETIIKFKVQSKSELQQYSKMMSIDDFRENTVIAYTNAQELEAFKELGIPYEVMPHPSVGKSLTMATTVAEMENWDRYPTHGVYLQMMQDFADNYPEICRIETIGNSEDGRPVRVLKITDNPDADENEPEFFYTGQMHGDEIVSYIMMLRVADHLLNTYGKEQLVTDLINNVEIWINPLSNPDGTYNGGDNSVSSATRSNSNGVDLNRNFPTPNDQTPTYMNEAEIQMMIDFAEAHNFVLSANIHSGAVLVNFPWDSWLSSQNMHADHDWWYQVSRNYADAVHEINPNYMTSYDNGVTHGGDWYVVDGSRQDNMGYFHHGRELTLELSGPKMLDAEDLPDHWEWNKNALIGYIQETMYGIRGVVWDENKNPIEAEISISGHDVDNSQIFSDATVGNYHRMIDEGTWSLTFSASGQSDVTVNDIAVVDEDITIVDVMMGGAPVNTNLSGTLTDKDTGNPIMDAEVEIKGQSVSQTVTTDADGYYVLNDVPQGTYRIEITATGYMGAIYYETVTSTNNDISKDLIPALYFYGHVLDSETGDPVENAEIKVLNTSLGTVTSDAEGYYVVSGIMAGDYEVSVSAENFATLKEPISVSSGNNNFAFLLSPVTIISFEEATLPDGFSTSGDADWFIDTNEGYHLSQSARSGAITHSQSSNLEYTYDFPTASTVTFALKTSVEGTSTFYDFLEFFIDGSSQGRWKGETDWTEVTFDVSEGEHTLKWTYERDGNSGGDQDIVWIDMILLPQEPGTNPIASFSTNSILFELDSDAPTSSQDIVLTNIGSGILSFTNSMMEGSWSGISTTPVSLGADENTVITVDVDGTGMNSGMYYDTLIVNSYETFKIPVLLDYTVVGIGDINENNFMIYPNPTSGLVHISADQQIEKVAIYNTSGKLIYERNVNQENQVSVKADIKEGVYFIRVSTMDKILTKKLIVQ